MPLGKEDIMHKQFASQIAALGVWKRLSPNLVWWNYSTSGEARSAITGALLKAKGAKRGEADFRFRLKKGKIMHNIYIEFKAGKNKQSEFQVEFEKTCEDVENERYYLVYSVDDALQILEREGIILS